MNKYIQAWSQGYCTYFSKNETFFTQICDPCDSVFKKSNVLKQMAQYEWDDSDNHEWDDRNYDSTLFWNHKF